MDSYAQTLSLAIDAARAAGALLREEFHRPGGPRGHVDHADADEQAERLIRDHLLSQTPFDYLGEETGRADRGDNHRLWLVDPNDGTRDYLRGRRGTAVSIGLLRDGVPVLGVVFAFCYPDDEGDLIAWAEGCPLTRNGVTMPLTPLAGRLDDPVNPPPLVLVSVGADTPAAANVRCVAPGRYIASPSVAYRLARVAAGDGLAAVSLSGPGDWDLAAGHALLRARGGAVVDEGGHPVRYSADGSAPGRVRWCFAGSPEAVRQLVGRDWESCLDETDPYPLTAPVSGRSVADAGLLARAQGCLLGQLAGDALGGLVEFRSVEAIAAEYPAGVRDLKDGGTWSNMAGQPTDDSEMALTLARTLVREGRHDPGAVLDAYCRWWPDAWDRGGTISQALSAAYPGRTTAERLTLIEQHVNRDRPSNGSLMRCSPLGIFFAGRPEEAADAGRRESRLTHASPVCQDSCAVYLAAVAAAVGDGGGTEAAYRAALAEVERAKVHPEVRDAVGAARVGPPADYVTNMGWVLIALQNAFYQLLHARSLEEGIIETVRQGGDTDTTGAIAGALLGAVHGRDAVPARWRRSLLACRPLPPSTRNNAHPRPPEYWPSDALELAEALLLGGGRVDKPPD